MNIAIYSYEDDQNELQYMLEDQCEKRRRRPVFQFFDNYDSMIRELPTGRCDMVIVARNGADGMVGAQAAKDILPMVPLVWFSDDLGFGPQSYRIDCAYFAVRPITTEMIERALERCEPMENIYF